MDDSFKYTFPALRGIQAKREYYVSMCPLHLIPKLFVFNEGQMLPELRAQRVLNKTRLPEIAKYIVGNSDNYTFSAITASVDAQVEFEPMGANREAKRLGLLHIPMSAKFVLNDGQHRRAAIELALKEKPELANETIAVVFFHDLGLERCQQMFADLNRHAIRPSKSIGILYEHRDNLSLLAKIVALKSPVFQDVVDMERSTLSLKSNKLFTLSSIYTATCALLANVHRSSLEAYTELAISFWEEVAKQFPEWQQVRNKKISAEHLRRDYIHSHAIALQAIGRAGNVLLVNGKTGWKNTLKGLKNINWSRSNAALWEGRAMVGGRVSKASNNVTLTTNAIKKSLGINLSPEEQRVENASRKGDHDRN
jgi:DNA sulfur modification protein DndB